MLESSKPRTTSRRRRLTRLATFALTCALLPGAAAGAATVSERPLAASAVSSAAPTQNVQVAWKKRKDNRHVQKQKKGRKKPAAGVSSRAGLLGAQNEWLRVVKSAPVARDSKALVANLTSQVEDHWGGVAAFNWNQYNISFYAVDSTVPRADVKFDDCQRKGTIPKELYSPAYGAHFTNVPIPSGAIPARGTDGELTIWDQQSDQFWEFWKANEQADGWHACWGGRIDNYSRSNGQFPGWMGTSASGLSLAPGTVGIDEMRAGRIEHALTLQLIDAANWNLVSYPAKRSDGWDPARRPDAIREGQRFRLPAGVNLDKLGLSPIARAVAVAAKKYGFIVTDRSGAVAVVAESGLPAQAKTGVDPWNELRGGVPGYAVMRNFPWNKLKALPVDYGKPTA